MNPLLVSGVVVPDQKVKSEHSCKSMHLCKSVEANSLLYGIGVPQNGKRALEIASAGVASDCAYCADCKGVFADCHFDDGTLTAEHLQFAKDSKAADSPYGQVVIAKCHLYGYLLNVDCSKAAKLFSDAAAQGLACAQYKLGRMLEEGQGVAQNYAEAMRLYRLAAAQRYEKAYLRLGAMFYRGCGVIKDKAEAMRLYYLAVEQENPHAQFKLARLFDKGQNVKKTRLKQHDSTHLLLHKDTPVLSSN